MPHIIALKCLLVGNERCKAGGAASGTSCCGTRGVASTCAAHGSSRCGGSEISVSSREQQSIRIGLGLGQVLENSRVAIRPEVLFTQYIFYFSNKAVVSKFIVSQARLHQDTAENSTFF